MKNWLYLNYRKVWAIAYFLVLLSLVDTVYAAPAGSLGGGERLIKLMQQASFWVGMGVCIWGIVEMQLDYPGWRARVLKGVIGYIMILLVPLIFVELRDSLQIDVWEQLR